MNIKKSLRKVIMDDLMEFLKPSKRKIVLFIFFSTIFLLECSPPSGYCGPNGLIRFILPMLPLTIFNVINFPLVWLCKIFTIFNLISALIFIVSYGISMVLGNSLGILSIYLFIILGYFFLIIYGYFLSSLIIWVHDKVRRK